MMPKHKKDKAARFVKRLVTRTEVRARTAETLEQLSPQVQRALARWLKSLVKTAEAETLAPVCQAIRNQTACIKQLKATFHTREREYGKALRQLEADAQRLDRANGFLEQKLTTQTAALREIKQSQANKQWQAQQEHAKRKRVYYAAAKDSANDRPVQMLLEAVQRDVEQLRVASKDRDRVVAFDYDQLQARCRVIKVELTKLMRRRPVRQTKRA